MGRGWHHGKRVGARIGGFSSALPLPIGRARGFPRLPPEIEENPSAFDPPWAKRIQPRVLHHAPGSRRPRPAFNRSRTPPSTSRGEGTTVFPSRTAHHEPLRARTRNCRYHRRTSEPADRGRAADCRALLVHLRHWLTLGRASGRVAGSGIRSSAGSMVAPGGGNAGDDLASIPELPSTDRRRAVAANRRGHSLGLHSRTDRAEGAERCRAADRSDPNPTASPSCFLWPRRARAGTDR